ncbi:MAG: sigma-70 family RNA polymerase sigma factor [Elusimicrobia bacterium]|nr:sigma-70 family RNA polymerase sigma factor [Elusimicrobiota bacterium]
MERTDEELIREYLAGDGAAYTALFHRHKGRIFNFALRMLANRAEAEDVTQETFIRLFEKRYQETQQAKLSTWLFTVARNASLTRLRSRKLLQPLWFKRSVTGELEEWDIPDTADPPSGVLQQKELTRRIRQAIAALPEDQREALILREYEKKDYAEIAQILGCALSKVKIDIFRGREALRANLTAFLKEDRP